MRVVSLLPAATDIVVALGAAECLVGVTHECDEAALPAAIPRVTSTTINAHESAGIVDAQVRQLHHSGVALFQLNEAVIAALAPDLIVTQALCDVCAVHEDDVRALAARLSSRPAVITLGARTLTGVLDDIATVASAIERRDEGEELRAGLRSRVQRVHETLKRAHAPRPTVIVIEWTDPFMTAGHWVPDLVRRAGGTDVGAEPGVHSVVRSVESLRALRAEVVIVSPCGYGLDAAAAVARELALRGPWDTSREVWAMDSNRYLSRPGPGLVQGIETLARIFNPGYFTPISPVVAERIR